MAVIGTQQSPILINTDSALPLAKPTELMEILYRKGQKFTGWFDEGGGHHPILKIDDHHRVSVRFRGVSWKLLQVHVHTESEHVVDQDVEHDFEVHFVHVPSAERASSKKHAEKAKAAPAAAPPKLVIGILYHPTARRAAGKGLMDMARQLDAPPAEAGSAKNTRTAARKPIPGKVEPWAFFPRVENGDEADLVDWFHYEGSLTGPPYSEDVSWFVMREPARLDKTTLGNLPQHASQEARALQELNRRLVVKSFR
jgi:carbonic anhydrase